MARGFAMLMFTAFLFSGPAGYTCDSVGESIENINVADVVFIGNVADYRVITPEGSQRGSLKDYALITFDVSETLKGDRKEGWQLYWQNHDNYPLPDKFIIDRPLIVSAVFSDNPVLSFRQYSPKELGPQQSDFLVVLQGICDPFIFNSGSETLVGVKNELDGNRIYEGDTPENCYMVRWRNIEGRLEMERILSPCSED